MKHSQVQALPQYALILSRLYDSVIISLPPDSRYLQQSQSEVACRIEEHLECLTYFQDNMDRLGDTKALGRANYQWVSPSVPAGMLGPYVLHMRRYPQLDECMVRTRQRFPSIPGSRAQTVRSADSCSHSRPVAALENAPLGAYGRAPKSVCTSGQLYCISDTVGARLCGARDSAPSLCHCVLAALTVQATL